jgi:PAS domain S-box-containing protein
MDFRYLLNKQFAHLLSALPEDFNVLAMALESTNSGVVITDCRQPDNPIIFCNHAFENMTGYSREEIIGQNCRFLQGNDRAQDELIVLGENIAKGVPVTVELRNYHKNGTLFWNELSIAPVRDTEGAVSHFIGIQNDVTRKKTMEIDLMQQIDFLNNRLTKQDKYIKKVEEILFGIMQTSRECIVILDEQLQIVKANPNFFQIFRQNQDEVIGASFGAIQNGQWDDPKLHHLLLNALKEDKRFNDFSLHLSKPHGWCKEVTVTGSKVQIKGIPKDFVLVTIRCKFNNEEKEESLDLLTR